MLLLFFAQSDGIALSANDPSGAFQSSGTFHGASWLDRKVIFRSAACFLAYNPQTITFAKIVGNDFPKIHFDFSVLLIAIQVVFIWDFFRPQDC